jgi:NAD(P)-dependent dehydrogenase (short-subunit alcohol dehydrogenase family)
MSSRVAFVTGAGRGVGRAIALRLAQEGYALALAGRSDGPLAATAAEVRRLGADALPVRCDVRNRDDVDAAVSEAESALGPIDVLVNNAGIAESGAFESMPDELWDLTIDTNLTGTYNCMRRVVPGMFDRRRGRVINIASTAAQAGFAYTSAYVASKHGVLGLTRAVALEARRFEVTVNAVCPGWINTEMTNASITRIVERTGRTADEARQALEAMNRSGRLIEPAEVAEVCAQLASEAGSVRNGEAIDLQ